MGFDERPEESRTAAVDIGLLGPLDVRVQGRPITIGSIRACRLLALLAANANTIVPFDRIVDTLWDDPPGSARQQVYNVVSGLRRSLAAGGVELAATATGYQLAVPVQAVDALRFTTDVEGAERARTAGDTDGAVRLLERALSQWRGAAFSGLSCATLENMATLLGEQRLAAVELLAGLRLRQGDAAASLNELFALVAEHPFRESLRAALMKVLHHSGNQAEAITVYETGRRLLAEELGLDPGPVLQAVHQQILTGARGVENGAPQSRHAEPARPDAEARPSVSDRKERNFLPRDIPQFTGRAVELSRLVDQADNAGARALVISAINGMGGVGKTTLAVHLAHRLAKDYPDGQYFIDLRGFTEDSEPMGPLQALSVLLRSSGTPPELMPPDLEARSALWRARVANQKLLLLLDNAADAAQVRPLLPGAPEALVLISSRRKLASLEGAVPLSLDVLPRADAISLFARVVGDDRVASEQSAVAEAVELCGRLPLAIQVAGARLRDRPSWSVGHLVEQLRDQRSRPRILATGDRDVMSVLAWSYRQLDERLQTVFRVLGIHLGPDFDAYAAAAVAGLSLEEAEACLEELFEVNLLEQPAAGRYRFHDLVRDCARAVLERHADEAERAAAIDRLLDYYLCSVTLWCEPISKPIFRFDSDITYGPEAVKRATSREESLGLLEVEYRNLVAAMRLAATAGRHSLHWRLTGSLLSYFGMMNYGVETEKLLESALRSAREVGSVTGESTCLIGLAIARKGQGSITEAIELATLAIELSRSQGAVAREVSQRTVLGAMYLDENRFTDALACFTEALGLASAIDDRVEEANLTNNLGVIHRELEHLDQAQEYFRRTLVLDEGTKMPQSRALTLNNIAQVLYLQGHIGEAAGQFIDALDASRTATSRLGEALALTGLCTVHRLLGATAESLDCGREALELARASEMYDVEGDALNALGDTHLSIDDLETAEAIFVQAGNLASRYGSGRYTARSREGLAHVAAMRGAYQAAEEHWRAALAIYPGGVVHPSGAKRHLEASGRGTTTCWRCAHTGADQG